MTASRHSLKCALVVFLMAVAGSRGDEPEPATTNTFPTVPEVLGGATFATRTEQDIYFLRAIHDRYSAHWEDLLAANITLNDYVLSPEKLQRFVMELGEAMRGRNDSATCTNLARIVGDSAFYANANVNRPEILQAAARSLIQVGPDGRKALAAAFTESHYRLDPASLEEFADVIGEERPSDLEFVGALTDTILKFTTTNGAYFPRCASAAAKNVIELPGGPAALRTHLNPSEALGNPGLFEAVVEGIGAVGTNDFSGNLKEIRAEAGRKLGALADSPGGYRDDLAALKSQIDKVLAVPSVGGKAGN